jgi:hypothetical protein
MKEWSASNDKRQDNIMKRLKEANLSEQLYLFQRDLQFAREQEPAREKELAAQKVPTRTFTWYWKIWNPKNWAIHERENVNGQKYYTAVTWIPTSSFTDLKLLRCLGLTNALQKQIPASLDIAFGICTKRAFTHGATVFGDSLGACSGDLCLFALCSKDPHTTLKRC